MISNKNSILLILCLIVIAENIILITEIYCPALKNCLGYTWIGTKLYLKVVEW